MRGADVLVRALRSAADRFYTVPGYPVTEIAEALSAEICVNEKVALEYALGDSLAGRRAAVILKNVGLNTCADPLVNATTQGLIAGVVVVAGDDIEVAGSQNAQDSRYYGELAQLPVIEPGKETIARAPEEAFRASERFSRIALLRITPPALGEPAEEATVFRQDGRGSLADPELTMKGRAAAADRTTRDLFDWSRRSPLNRIRGGVAGVGAATGESRVVTVYPPPAGSGLLAETREYGRPFVREHRGLAAPPEGEAPETHHSRGFSRTFCRDCPFTGMLSLLADRKVRVVCDIGCSVLALNPPYAIGVASYGLGSSVAVAARSTGVALTGDYALLHSGINALIDVYEKQIPLLCIVMKNSRMAMTGGHPVADITDYLAWARPLVCDAADTETLARALVPSEEPVILIIEGRCPEGCAYETMEC
jgi:indolepyruvate ferredoxin oxidoreductase alpha subunit